eukprot:TRINITY_DN3564_c0_g1_i3.p1 TRINITY_DN3564_c0_g1~~TRINITY_DN3564_c0_g1_i3.p1  ORF type:complete len:272 (-),score=25.64 TRINITY_DN3564_c0_g1_i3:46-861(-)
MTNRQGTGFGVTRSKVSECLETFQNVAKFYNMRVPVEERDIFFVTVDKETMNTMYYQSRKLKNRNQLQPSIIIISGREQVEDKLIYHIISDDYCALDDSSLIDSINSWFGYDKLVVVNRRPTIVLWLNIILISIITMSLAIVAYRFIRYWVFWFMLSEVVVWLSFVGLYWNLVVGPPVIEWNAKNITQFMIVMNGRFIQTALEGLIMGSSLLIMSFSLINIHTLADHLIHSSLNSGDSGVTTVVRSRLLWNLAALFLCLSFTIQTMWSKKM